VVVHACHWLSGQVLMRVCVICPLWFAGQLSVCVSLTWTQVETQVFDVVTQSPQTLAGQVFVLVCVIEPLYPLGQLMLCVWVSCWQGCGQVGEILG
jgi:hypothetical protein